ncbi:hypothetical protein R5R35_000435 [Gryllus longicercus]|uniref:Rhodanese domain-containing protein n=1 Tax=Gryllus longicercus TaxID=2509291 RepID=A0AAN9VD66_9ORTH
MGSIILPLSYRLPQLQRLQNPYWCARNERQASIKLFQVNILAPHSQAMSTTVTPEMNLNYQDILQLTGDNKIILIDVREPKELQDNGVLPNSVNIPLGTVKEALQSSPQSFEDQYGIPLPDKNAPIVFSCHAGGRSMKALLAALEIGYKNARHYAGGFSDWKKNTENPQ